MRVLEVLPALYGDLVFVLFKARQNAAFSDGDLGAQLQDIRPAVRNERVHIVDGVPELVLSFIKSGQTRG
jgi:hypothetical protein